MPIPGEVHYALRTARQTSIFLPSFLSCCSTLFMSPLHGFPLLLDSFNCCPLLMPFILPLVVQWFPWFSSPLPFPLIQSLLFTTLSSRSLVPFCTLENDFEQVLTHCGRTPKGLVRSVQAHALPLIIGAVRVRSCTHIFGGILLATGHMSENLT